MLWPKLLKQVSPKWDDLILQISHWDDLILCEYKASIILGDDLDKMSQTELPVLVFIYLQ